MTVTKKKLNQMTSFVKHIDGYSFQTRDIVTTVYYLSYKANDCKGHLTSALICK